MNTLLFYCYALDAKPNSNHAKYMQFKELDKEIKQWQEEKTYKELFHSLAYSLMLVRAKKLLKQLDIL